MSKVIGMGGNPTQQPAQQPSINVNLMEQPTMKCAGCEGVFFQTHFIVKKVSKLATGSPVDQFAPIQILRCSDCGEVLKETLPDPNLL